MPASQSLYDVLVDADLLVNQKRLERARTEFQPYHILATTAPGEVRAVVKNIYHVTIATYPAVSVECDCPDWRQRGAHIKQPCKHILAVALQVEAPPAPADPPVPVAVSAKAEGLGAFGQRVAAAIGQAVARLADQVKALVEAGEIPFLIGPTGVAKTSAVRALATAQGWGFEEVAGAPSFADADLVGVKMAGGVEIPGVFARAFQRARDGENVLLFLDEFTRFNARAQDLLMRPLLPTAPEVAQATGIATDEPVRLLEAPIWGVEWAPAERVKVVMACNPWGAQLDPAFIRRVWPVFVEYDPAVADLFDDRVKTAITLSWTATQNGELPLPIEYGALVRAQGPGDMGIVTHFLHRLRAVDNAAAEGFKTLLEGQGISLP